MSVLTRPSEHTVSRCRMHSSLDWLAVVALACGLTPGPLAAQQPGPLGPPPPYGVQVTPDGATTASRIANTGGYSDSFTVFNSGLNEDTYQIACSGSTNVTCTGTNKSS